MTIIYRMSSGGYKKEKPSYINNIDCFLNAIEQLHPDIDEIQKWIIIADNLNEWDLDNIKHISKSDDSYDITIIEVDEGNGAATFRLALQEALKLPDNEIVYFVENDYIHRPDSSLIIEDALSTGADYVTLYLHPDKFLPPNLGGNPLVGVDGGYSTKIFRGKLELYALFDSTTMTFATRVKTLKEDLNIIQFHTAGEHPNDANMFWDLIDKNKRTLVCPLNTYSTHGESLWLAPLAGVLREDLESEWESHLHNIY